MFGAPNAFIEGHVEFAPTYKVHTGVEPLPEFDKSVLCSDTKKIYSAQRVPAWTDRIFFFSTGKVTRQPRPSLKKLARSASQEHSSTPVMDDRFAEFWKNREGYLFSDRTGDFL